MLNLATCGARCVVKVSAGLFDSSGHGSVWFLWLSWAKLVSVIAVIAVASWLSWAKSEGYGFLGPKLVYPQSLLLLSWFILRNWFF